MTQLACTFLDYLLFLRLFVLSSFFSEISCQTFLFFVFNKESNSLFYWKILLLHSLILPEDFRLKLPWSLRFHNNSWRHGTIFLCFHPLFLLKNISSECVFFLLSSQFRLVSFVKLLAHKLYITKRLSQFRASFCFHCLSPLPLVPFFEAIRPLLQLNLVRFFNLSLASSSSFDRFRWRADASNYYNEIFLYSWAI